MTVQFPIMKLTDVGSSEEEVEPYLVSEDFVLQQKFDGTRIMMIWDTDTDEILWSNNGKDPVGHAAAKLHLENLEKLIRPALARWAYRVAPNGALVLDGELLIRTGEYMVWDFIQIEELDKILGWQQRESKPWEERHIDLWDFLGYLPEGENIKGSPTAAGEAAKRSLWKHIVETNVEGGVSKHRESLYIPGTRTKNWVKHKLVKTADLVVMDLSRTFKPGTTVVHKGSATLGYFDADGMLKKICSSSLIGKDLTISLGDVVEVSYLYRESGGGGLVQPRIMRKRWDLETRIGDKPSNECLEDQFPEYSRTVVTKF